eukprot:15477975-Alexandrium_andersonii.AAC.1
MRARCVLLLAGLAGWLCWLRCLPDAALRRLWLRQTSLSPTSLAHPAEPAKKLNHRGPIFEGFNFGL